MADGSRPAAGQLALARIRAAGSIPADDVDVAALRAVLAPAGREVRTFEVDGHRHVTVGWDATTDPPIDGERITGPVATRAFAVTFAAALGCCWTDPASEPRPGSAAPVDDVVAAAQEAGVSYAWAVGALRHALSTAQLVDLRDDEVRLGAAVAAWSPAQLGAFRRIHDRLPTSPEPEPHAVRAEEHHEQEVDG